MRPRHLSAARKSALICATAVPETAIAHPRGTPERHAPSAHATPPGTVVVVTFPTPTIVAVRRPPATAPARARHLRQAGWFDSDVDPARGRERRPVRLVPRAAAP